MVFPFQTGIFLVAQAPPRNWDIYLPLGVMVGALALGGWAIIWIKRWREESLADAPLSSNDLLNHYEKLVAEGLLHPDEFARIKAQLQLPPEHGSARSPTRDSSSPMNPSTDSSSSAE